MVVSKHHGKTTFTLRGPVTKATSADFLADTEFFGIVFELGTFIPHLPTVNRLDRNDLILPEATGNAIWLNSATWQIPDYNNADTFVSRLVREGLLMRDPIVHAVFQGQPQPLSIPTLQYPLFPPTALTHTVIHQ